jgi:peptidoglycan/xylan/chitin deacetylase (PgdA/CDA1 family)
MRTERGAGDILVLSYHTVSPWWPSQLAVLPESFERQIRTLKARGYRSVGFEEAVKSGGTPGRRVAVTFDDGYRSVLRHAHPILERHGWTATVFVPVAFVGAGVMSWPGIEGWSSGPHASDLEALSWEELRQLAGAGWEVGSHTCFHADLPTLGDEELARELVHSRETCERELGRPCRSLAYPFGRWDDRVLRAVRAAGYTCAATVPDNLAIADALLWPRLGIYRGDGAVSFALKVSPVLRRLRTTHVERRLLPLARVAQRLLRG